MATTPTRGRRSARTRRDMEISRRTARRKPAEETNIVTTRLRFSAGLRAPFAIHSLPVNVRRGFLERGAGLPEIGGDARGARELHHVHRHELVVGVHREVRGVRPAV